MGAGRSLAVAHQIPVMVYCMVKTGTPYQDLGGHYFDKLHPERAAQRLVQRLLQLGLDVIVTPSEPLSA